MNQSQKEFRKRRGREIAERFRIEPDGDGYKVPSETRTKKTYHVVFTPTDVSCTFLYHAATRDWCKHIYAVEFDLKRKGGLDLGEAPVGPRRPTYPRDHSANTAAQTREEDECALMLFALAQGITEPLRTRGRPPVSRRDAAIALNSKVYHGKSARRTMARLDHAVRQGYLSKPVTSYAIHDYMEDPEMGPILEDMLVRSSLPLSRIETCFAADSTGMSSSRFIPWSAIKYRGITERNWAKIHVMIGVKTLIVTAAVIEDRDSSDLAQLPRLLETTARNFTIKEVYADKVYNTKHNQEVIASYSAKGNIPFKDNHSGKGGGIWTEQYLRWLNDREEFDRHYHQRSKVEAAFMSMKTNFGDSLRSRSEVAMRNEALRKLICHNLVCLNRAMDKYNIGFEFLTAALEAAA